MKRVVSVSIGSSARNHQAEVEVLGEKFLVERIGTDGSISRAIALVRSLDGKVEAFGMGGIDLYIWAGQKRYIFREAKKLAAAAVKTPMVDGSGLKNTLERQVVEHLQQKEPEMFQGKRVLMTSAMDRYGMADALVATGAEVLFGDVIFALGLPIPLYSLAALNRVARVVAPIVVQLPFKLIYPTGSKQEKSGRAHRMHKYYHWADIIAGDFHMIKKHLPPSLKGKMIITNTVTQRDVDLLRSLGAWRLVTTTPNLGGRSFGTNVMEALLVCLIGKPTDEITSADYWEMLQKVQFVPRIEDLAVLGA